MEGCDDDDDRALLARARHDPAALEKLIFRHYDRLARFAHGRLPTWLRRRVSVDDVLQETCTRVFRNVASFEPRGPDAFFAWCCRIAENHIRNLVDFHRAQKRWTGTDDAGPGALDGVAAAAGKRPSEVAALRERAERLAACMRGLDPPHEQVVRHRYVEGHSNRSTAALMNRSERATEQLLARAVRQLRRLFPRSRP